jgi:hypothetical protein
MTDPDIDALLAGHALGDLDEAERARLTALLQEQPELQQRLDEFRTSLELLPLALPEHQGPPARLRRRLLAGGASTPESSDPNANGALPGGLRRAVPGRQAVRQWLVPTLLAAGLLLVGGELHRTRLQLAALEDRLTSQRGVAASIPLRRMPLQASGPGMAAAGEVLVTGDPGHNLLVLDHLPPPPPNHTYRLWARVNGREVGCVHFVPDPGGHVAMAIPSQPTSAATSVSVSLERETMGERPQGPRVMQGRDKLTSGHCERTCTSAQQYHLHKI